MNTDLSNQELRAAGMTSCGKLLDTDSQSLGLMRDSRALLNDAPALAQRLKDDGYLLIRDYFQPELILNARHSILEKMDKEGLLDPNRDLMEGCLNPQASHHGFRADLIQEDAAVDRVVFGQEIRAFYETLLQGQVRHFDYKWLRTVGPGEGTKPHCDVVYMGRGTWDLFTAWIPYGHVDFELGGLMLLEGSHRQGERLKSYLEMDVDEYCTNRPRGREVGEGKRQWEHPQGGFLSKNPVSLREKLGGRWLVGKFSPGDLLTFGMGMVHASLDNRTGDRVRISTDTRYQLASEPIDERWIGESPIGHGMTGKRGRIC